MRILGLDVGDKRIGVAVSDELKITAQGIEVIERKSLKEDMERFRYLVEKFEVSKIVVGLPKNMDGSLGFQSQSTMKYVEKIKAKLNVDMEFWDERLTTVMAERTLIDADVSRKKRKNVVDKIAATIILQSYLDSKIS